MKVTKLSKRFDQDISAVMGAFVVAHDGETITDARLAFGGMAGIPKRAIAVEKALIGKPFLAASFKAAARALPDDFSPLSDMRGSDAYRLQVAQNVILKYGYDICGDASTRLAGVAATMAGAALTPIAASADFADGGA